MYRRYILVFYIFCWLIGRKNFAYGSHRVNFTVDSELKFLCKLPPHQIPNTTKIQMIHHRDEVIFETRLDYVPIGYTITADERDNGSKILCYREPCDMYPYKKCIYKTVELIMNSDQHYSIPEIEYNEDNPTNHVCNILGSQRKKLVGTSYYNVSQDVEITVTPADSGSIYFCQAFSYSVFVKKKLRRYHWVRNIYHRKKYIYKSVPSHKITIIGVCAGVLVCGILVTSFLFLRHCGKKNPPDVTSTPPPSQALTTTDSHVTPSPNEDMEINDYPGQLAYAELELAERSPSESRFQNRIDLPYAQIVGFLAKKKQEK